MLQMPFQSLEFPVTYSLKAGPHRSKLLTIAKAQNS